MHVVSQHSMHSVSSGPLHKNKHVLMLVIDSGVHAVVDTPVIVLLDTVVVELTVAVVVVAIGVVVPRVVDFMHSRSNRYRA